MEQMMVAQKVVLKVAPKADELVVLMAAQTAVQTAEKLETY